MAGERAGPIIFENRVLRGSRLLTLVLTGLSDAAFADTISRLIAPHGRVAPDGLRMPRGTVLPQGSRLGPAEGLLEPRVSAALKQWWIEGRHGAYEPTWDVACQAEIGGRPGLVLAEAKAHADELRADGVPTRNAYYRAGIRTCLREAGRGLDDALPGWNLSGDSHYPLASRFAWAWKLAGLGLPVILLYLGYLDAGPMSDRGWPFASSAAWDGAVRDHARGIVPEAAWNTPLPVGGSVLIPLIRSVRLGWQVDAG